MTLYKEGSCFWTLTRSLTASPVWSFRPPTDPDYRKERGSRGSRGSKRFKRFGFVVKCRVMRSRLVVAALLVLTLVRPAASQDTERMEQVVQAEVAKKVFMGSVL